MTTSDLTKPTHALYSVAQIRQIEQSAASHLPAGTLMQRAGKAAADAAAKLLGHARFPVLVLAGPGNNGGDALEAAAHLEQAGFETVVVLCGDPQRYSPEGAVAYHRAQDAGVQFTVSGFHQMFDTRPWSLVIDGLLGIGLTRPVTGELKDLVEAVNRLACPVLALDVPSGLNADTGRLVDGPGEAGLAIHASHTITFIGDKPGLHTGSGRDQAGMVEVASLQIDPGAFPQPAAILNGIAQFAHGLKRRPHNSHKGSYGDLALLGGAPGMQGAIVLAARAAAMCGAGRVFAGFVQDSPAFDLLHPELMCRAAASLELEGRAVAAGPGLGNTASAKELVARALATASPLLLDADALNLLASDNDLQAAAGKRSAPWVITPHPLEAARLLGISSSQVQADRLDAARQLAQRLGAIAVLKGSGTVIAHPDGRMAINTSGNPALATAGSGDVLSGIAGALLAQSWPAWEAALAAVWLHGHAADVLVEKGHGPIGLTAGELIGEARLTLNRLTQQYGGHG